MRSRIASVVGSFSERRSTVAELWRSCATLQFRDASGSPPVNASGKPLHSDRHLLAQFSCASTSNPNLNVAVSENFRRDPPFAFGVIPCSQRLQIGHPPRLDSALHPPVPLGAPVGRMRGGTCAG